MQEVAAKVAATKYPGGTVNSATIEATTTARPRANPGIPGKGACLNPVKALCRLLAVLPLKPDREADRHMDAKTAFLSTRPWSFTMTFSSVTMGTLMAAIAGPSTPSSTCSSLAE